MAGSIRHRPDRGSDTWELRVYLGRDAGGKVRHRSTLFRGTKRAAEHELARLVASQDRSPGVIVAGEQSRTWGPTTTINDAIEGWRANGWDDLSPSTVRRYESIFKVNIAPRIGKRKIASLSPYDVERYFRELKADGLAEASVRQVRAVLHRSCRLARKWSGNQLPNPVADTELPAWKLSDSDQRCGPRRRRRSGLCSTRPVNWTRGRLPSSGSLPPPGCAGERRARSAGRTSTGRLGGCGWTRAWSPPGEGPQLRARRAGPVSGGWQSMPPRWSVCES